MDTPVPTSFRRSHKLLFGVIIAIGILLYAAFNVWVYRYATSGKASSPSVVPAKAGISATTPSPPAKQDPAPRDTPTPRPTGPGSYACDPLGNCNIYENPEKIGCPKTFADSRCLDSCGDTSVRCPK